MPHTHRAAAADLSRYAPETWNEDQRRIHESESLDDAFTQASCLAGGWYDRPVVIWMWIDAAHKEHYIIAPEGSQPKAVVPSAPPSRIYKVEALDR